MTEEYLLDGSHPDNPLNPQYQEYDIERIQLKIDGAKRNLPKIYCIGDCLTLGIDVYNGCNYPQYLQQMVADYEVINLGRTMLRMDLLITYKNIMILKSGNSDIACVWCGTNDLFLGSQADKVFENFINYCNLLWEKNIKVVPLTAMPRPEYSLTLGYEERRQEFNQLIRDNFWEVADTGGHNLIGLAENKYDRNYYQDDQVHLTENGYNIVAKMVADVIKILK